MRILSRVLSAEIGNQEIWKEQDLERFGCDKIGRDEIIEEIRQFMKDNDIKFDDLRLLKRGDYIMENSVIEILMRRDELTRQEAEEVIEEVGELMIENPDDAAEILMDELGLEMDYLFDILDF